MTQERFEELMVKVVDGMATPLERQALDVWLADKPSLRAELEEHLALKAVTDGWVERLELDLVEDRHQAEPLTRMEAGVGWALLGVGTSVLGGFGLSTLLLDPTVPAWVKLGTGLCASGTLVLLFAAIRWRLKTRRHDKYTEVVR